MDTRRKVVLLFGDSAPGWVLSGADLDIDFVNNRAWNGRSTVTPASLLTCTRASTGYATTSAGALTSFAANTLRQTDLGVLIEGARTNLFLRSQELDNASWSKASCTVTADAVTAPDGTTTAEKFIPDNAAGTAYLVQNLPASGVGTYTASVYVKAAELTAFKINMYSVEDGENSTTFNLSNGTITSGSGTITALANGWYRCTTSKAFTAFTSGQTQICRNTVAGDGTSGLYTWGAQVELGSFASSYIPTTTVAVTRAADAMTFNGGSLPTGYSQTQGSAVAQAAFVGFDGGVYQFDDTTAGNRIGARSSGGSLNAFTVTSGATVQDTGGMTPALTVGVAFKHGKAWAAGDFADVLDGGTPVTDAAGAIPVVTQLGFGIGPGLGQGYLYLRRFACWNTRVTDAALQAHTT